MKRIIAMSAVATTLVFGLGLAGAQTDTATSKTEKVPSKRELKRLVGTARTPEDHHKLAAYYRQSAERFEQEAAEHEGLSEEYRKNPPRLLKRAAANAALAASHCNNFITFARKAAAEERALAAVHEQAATETGIKP